MYNTVIIPNQNLDQLKPMNIMNPLINNSANHVDMMNGEINELNLMDNQIDEINIMNNKINRINMLNNRINRINMMDNQINEINMMNNQINHIYFVNNPINRINVIKYNNSRRELNNSMYQINMENNNINILSTNSATAQSNKINNPMNKMDTMINQMHFIKNSMNEKGMMENQMNKKYYLKKHKSFNYINNKPMNKVNLINNSFYQINQMNNPKNFSDMKNSQIHKENIMNNFARQKNNIENSLDQMILKNNRINNLKEIDVYPYILEEKKILILVRNDQTKIKIKIPISLRKNELYITAEQFKINKYSDIKLFYKNKILNNDETNIYDIINGDEVIIFEEFEEIYDQDYYQNYLIKYKNGNLINITFETPKGQFINLVLSKNITIKEMINKYFWKMKISEKYKNNFIFTYKASTLDFNDISTLFEKDILNNNKISVTEKNNDCVSVIKGKKLKVSITNQNELNNTTYIGTLNQIKDLFSQLKDIYPNYDINNIIIEGKELKGDEEQTFSSIGIRENFICNISLTRKDENEFSFCIII